MTGERRHTAVHCLVAIARHHGVELDSDRLLQQYPQLAAGEPSPETLARVATDAGFKARPLRIALADLAEYLPVLPAIARLRNGNSVIVAGVRAAGEAQSIVVLDPLADRTAPLVLSAEKFAEAWDGELLLLKRRFAILDTDQPFGLGWFVAEAGRQRGAFAEIAAAAIAISVIGLATPLFFQAVIDKVLVHHSASTLQVLGVGIVIALLFDAALEYLRGLVLLHATSRIDVRLATRSHQHLLALPIAFFEHATAGTIARHLQQSTVIRQFLTGSLFMTAIDSLGLVVFLALLFAYSWKLTLVVLLFALLAAAIAATLLGPYRRRLFLLYRAEGERQSHLVESLHGMATVKSLGLEPVRRESWEQLVAQAVSQQFRVGGISLAARSSLGALEKLSLVAVIWLGAGEVIGGALTVGALVAFQMLAGRVSGPLARLASLVHEFQEVSLSIRMLGTVMNTPTELPPAGTVRLRPDFRGGIEFERVSFTYEGVAESALRNVSLRIAPGSIIGVVGASGSGKTTLVRLIQGMYRGYAGFIRVDGTDLREIDLAHLRRHLGVVPQESFLFRGTVRDNIAAGRPQSSFEEVVSAARLSGADAFVRDLPGGYDTLIEENAPNLSGGQRQRIAIARALLVDPNVLILDEATSALDPESEAAVRQSIARIARGRTLIIVSHRLSMLADCASILVLARGELVGHGTQRELMDGCTPFRDLWNLQQTSK